MFETVYINLPVRDLPANVAFWKALGMPFVPEFSGEGIACLQLGSATRAMLTTHARFHDFTPQAIADPRQSVEMLLNLQCHSRAQVDALVAKALAAGGSTHDQAEDLGFMYSHSFLDPDGHGWGVFCMTGTPPARDTEA